ncbi:hypothetical protein D6774_03215 [Candidatus Woesearchaeota archaeon]|nr:MAG: hypothetical protein D6774_03215 [Candidatus Woesearchaeota archaeon]
MRDNKTAIICIWFIALITAWPAEMALALSINHVPGTVDVSAGQAQLQFTTDASATATVKYGVAQPPGLSSPQSTGTQHIITLSNLTPSTTYYYYIEATDGVESTRLPSVGTYNFVSAPPPDAIPPGPITALEAQVQPGQVLLDWQAPTDSDLRHYAVYRNGNLLTTVKTTSYTDAQIGFDTPYTYEVAAVDTSGNEGPRASVSVTTLGEHYRQIHLIPGEVTVVGTTTLITWSTDVPTTGEVLFGREDLSQSEQSTNLSTQGQVILRNLEQDTTYQYRIVACDEFNNCANSTISTFKTTTPKPHGITLETPTIDEQGLVAHPSLFLDVKGTTTPGSIVRVFVEGIHKRTAKAAEDGSFNFRAITLSTTKTTEIRIESTSILEDQPATITFNAIADTQDPVVDVTLANFTTQPYLDLEGNITDTSDIIKVSWTINYLDDQEGPPAPLDLDTKALGPNSIELTWDPVDDAQGYVIYREDVGIKEKRIIATTTTTEYVDNQVSTDSEYIYSVAAYDEYQNIGAESPAARQRTQKGGEAVEPAPAISFPEPCSDCSQIIESVNYQGFKLRIGPLTEGRNEYTITFADRAGRSQSFNGQVIFDESPPRFITPATSAELEAQESPTSIPDIEIEGKVDGPATVYAFLGPAVTQLDQAVSVVETDENGSFVIPVNLLRAKFSGKISSPDEPIFCDDEDVDGDGVKEWEEAAARYPEIDSVESCRLFEASLGSSGGVQVSLPLDLLGLPSDGIDTTVTLLAIDPAGQRSEPLSGVIKYASCSEGSDWSVSVEGPFPTSLNSREILEGVATLGFVYNLTWIGGGQPGKISTVQVSPAPLGLSERTQFDQPEDWISAPLLVQSTDKTRGSVTIGITPRNLPSGSNVTIRDQEENISNHRKGQCGALAGGGAVDAGCIKMKLQLEIAYSSNQLGSQDFEAGLAGSKIQKACIPVSVIIDERINPDKIPRDFLKASVQFLNDSISILEGIYKPIAKIAQIIYISCGVTFAATLGQNIIERFQCKYSGGVKNIIKASLGVSTLERAAEQGVCKEVFDDVQDQGACERCAKAKQRLAQMTTANRWFCDRMICPPVPSLQEYIKRKSPVGAPSVTADRTITAGNVPEDFNQIKSSCQGIGVSNEVIKEQFTYRNNFKKNADNAGESAVSCYYETTPGFLPWIGGLSKTAGGHPYTAQCCQAEYLSETKPAAPLVDPLKLSYCLADPDAPGCGPSNFVNGIAGICQADTKGDRFASPKGIVYDDEKSSDLGLQTKEVYYYIDYEDGELVAVYRGYIKKQFNLENAQDLSLDGAIKVSGGDYFIKDSSINLKDAFLSESSTGDGSTSGVPEAFANDLQNAGVKVVGGSAGKPNNKLIQQAYEEVRSKLNTPDRKYVLQPAGSFVQSIMTLCISGILSYLKLWIRVMTMLQMCFQSILITGDGSSGQCEAIVSQYICDLLFEAISCFVNTYKGIEGGKGGFGALFASIADANSQMLSRTAERYGEDNIFTNQFSTQNLANAACVWAFTGNFPEDLFNVFSTDLELDINTTTLIAPATRRFQNYDANGKPRYVYNIGYSVFAGTDINYRIELVCSPQGDCASGVGDDVQQYRQLGYPDDDTCKGLATKASRTACTGHIIQPVESWVRYDKVRVCWAPTKNNQAIPGGANPGNPSALSGCNEVDIRDVGGAPSFCKLDTLTGTFKCAVDFGSDNTATIKNIETLQDQFNTGDSEIFNIDVALNVPEVPETNCVQDCKYTKYLEVLVFNDKGRQVWPPLGETAVKRLNGRQVHHISFYNTFDWPNTPPFKITPEMFTAGSGGTCEVVQDGLVIRPSVEACTYFPSDGIIEIKADGSTLKTRFKAGTYTRETLGSNGVTDELSGVAFTPCVLRGANYVCSILGKTLSIPAAAVQSTQGTLKSDSTYIVFKQESKQTGECDASERTWKAQITLYDAFQDGLNGWRRSGTITDDGNRQQRYETFKVRCSGGLSQENKLIQSESTKILTATRPSAGGFSVSGLSGDDQVQVLSFENLIPSGFPAFTFTVSTAARTNPILTLNLKDAGVFGANSVQKVTVQFADGSGFPLQVPLCTTPTPNLDTCIKNNNAENFQLQLEKKTQPRKYVLLLSIASNPKVDTGSAEQITNPCEGKDNFTQCGLQGMCFENVCRKTCVEKIPDDHGGVQEKTGVCVPLPSSWKSEKDGAQYRELVTGLPVTVKGVTYVKRVSCEGDDICRLQ